MASGDKTTVYDMVKVRAELAGSGFTADKVDGKDADAFVNVDLSNVTDSAFLDKIKAVDGAGSGIDADLVQGVSKDLLGIGGEGYQWVDETSNRSLDTTYTNTYGKPILLLVSLKGEGGTRLGFSIYIDDVKIGEVLSENADSSDDIRASSIIIPQTSTYKIENNYDSTIIHWFELK